MKVTPEPKHCRDKFVMYISSSEKKYCLSCMEIYFKFARLELIRTKDWIECKNDPLRIYNQLGKPRLLKPDRDGAFSSFASKRWLESEDIKIELNTTNTGIAGIERLQTTKNEKLRMR